MGTIQEGKEIEWLQKTLPYFYYLKLINNKFTVEQLVDLCNEIDEEGMDYVGGFEIVDKPQGKEQNTEVNEVWCNQTLNGGYEGDSFAGRMYVRINKNEWLTWSYSC